MSIGPAQSIIEKFGGVRAVASITGKDISSVYRWMYPREKGGTNGFIPNSEARRLLEHARLNGIPLSADEFFDADPAPPERASA